MIRVGIGLIGIHMLKRGLIYMVLLLSTTLTGCPEDGDEETEDGESDKPLCDDDDLKSLGRGCCLSCGCNDCQTGVCLGVANGDYILNGVHGYLAADYPICTHECTEDGDCADVSMLSDGRQAVEEQFCDSFPEGNFCAVDLEASSGDDCGEPCPQGCCSPSGLSCCQPPFCSGDCIGSPCC